MARLRAVWGPPRSREAAWPETISSACPYSGDELLFDPSSHEDIVAHGVAPFPDRDQYASLDRDFHETYVGILEGRLPWGTEATLARALQIDAADSFDQRWPKPAWAPLPDAELAAVAEDWLPDMGQMAPERVLGPFADHRPPPPACQAAFAVMAFSPLMAPRIRPLVRGIRNKPRPSPDRRQSLSAAIMAPAMLWCQEEPQRLRPALPLGPHFVPAAEVAGLGDAPVWVGKAVPTRAGPTWLVAGLPFPGLPPLDVVKRRLRLEYIRLRRHERRLTVEDLLRERSEVLYRVVCEWWFEQDADAVLKLWRSREAWGEWVWPHVP